MWLWIKSPKVGNGPSVFGLKCHRTVIVHEKLAKTPILAVACPDRGAGNDPEAFGLTNMVNLIAAKLKTD